MPVRSTSLAAFIAACIGVALFSLMDAAMKHLALALGAYSAMLWRNLIGAVLSGALWFGSGGVWPKGAVLRLHIWRGVVVSAMGWLFFWSITVLPLAEAIALTFIAPLIALYLAALLLGERVGRAAIFASLLGLAGVAVILWGRFADGLPHHGDRAIWGVAAAFGSAMLFAYNLILARQQAQAAAPAEIAFFQTLTVIFCLGLFAPWWLVAAPAALWPMLGLAALLAVTSLFIMSWAYARAEAQILIPVEYSAFVWAALCGWIFFAEALHPPLLIGTALIITGCIIAARASARPQVGQVEELYA
ncbi:MAG: DMT family transporter [Sphingomonadaceae bacterium]|nr:DMT family transporter [Sphingomonadaceae bacterium]